MARKQFGFGGRQDLEEIKKSRNRGPQNLIRPQDRIKSEFNCLHSSNKMEASFFSRGTKRFWFQLCSPAILRKKCGSAPIF